jgi:hypothetical protein
MDLRHHVISPLFAIPEGDALAAGRASSRCARWFQNVERISTSSASASLAAHEVACRTADMLCDPPNAGMTMRARTLEEFRAEAERLGLKLAPGREGEMHRADCALAGCSSGGLPLGLQLLAPAFDDATALAIGHADECATAWRSRRPPLAA